VLPHFLAIGAAPAVDDATASEGIDVAVVNEHRFFVALLIVPPQHLAAAVGFHSECFRLRKTAAGEDDVVFPDQGSAGGQGGAIGGPERIAIGRIIRGDLLCAGDQQLIFPRHIPHDRDENVIIGVRFARHTRLPVSRSKAVM